MTTSGFSSDGEDSIDEGPMKWSLEYVTETNEYICGRCGQVQLADHNTEELKTHFKSCKNTKENAFIMIFKELRKMNQKFEVINAEVKKKVDEIKTEVMEEMKAEMINIKTEIKKEMEFNKEISDLKSKVEKDLEMKCDEKMTDKMDEMGVAQEVKMAQVSGVVETISTVVHSILEAKGTSSADTNEADRSKKEIEALWVKLSESERKMKSLRTGLEDKISHLELKAEAFSKQLTTNDEEIKARLKDETAEAESTKMTTFQVEPSPFHQLTIPMTCFNLIAHNYLFQPSFRWTIDDIETIMSQKTFEMTSQLFQWNGYPVQARAKLQLKENDIMYMSLNLEDQSKDDRALKDLRPIPRVFYLLKDKFDRNPQHKCRSVAYLSDSDFSYSLDFDRTFVRKSWFNNSAYKVNDLVDIEVYVEPSPMTQLVHSYDGTLEWNIENYSRRLQLEIDNMLYFQESPYFYTGPSGYKVQVGMYLNGSGAKGPTAYIMFLSGKFDADLPKSFPHSTTVTLVNRKDPERSITKTIIKDIENKKEYTIEICEVDEVEDLIENDTLFCKVVIKPQ